MAFNVIVHHLGQFVVQPRLRYIDVKVTAVPISVRRWSSFECLDNVADLGYTRGKFKVFWMTYEDFVAHNLRPFLTNDEAIVVATYATNNKGKMHLFVKHDVEELSSTPLDLLRVLDGSSSKNKDKEVEDPKEKEEAIKPYAT